jgi:hypothetical protein
MGCKAGVPSFGSDVRRPRTEGAGPIDVDWQEGAMFGILGG